MLLNGPTCLNLSVALQPSTLQATAAADRINKESPSLRGGTPAVPGHS